MRRLRRDPDTGSAVYRSTFSYRLLRISELLLGPTYTPVPRYE